MFFPPASPLLGDTHQKEQRKTEKEDVIRSEELATILTSCLKNLPEDVAKLIIGFTLSSKELQQSKKCCIL